MVDLHCGTLYPHAAVPRRHWLLWTQWTCTKCGTFRTTWRDLRAEKELR